MTKRKPVDEHSKGVARALEIITAQPGIFSKDIAAAARYTLAHTKNVLSVLSNSGVAKPVPVGVERGWYLAALAAPLLAQWERTRRRRDIKKPRPVTKRDRIHAMSKEPGGVSMAQIMGSLDLGLNDGGRHCTMMVHQGRLFRSQRPGARIRWFDTPEKATEWAAMPVMEPSEWVAPGVRAWDNPERRSQAKANQQARTAARQAEFAQRQADRARAAEEAQKAKRRKVVVRNVQAIKPLPGVAPTVTLHKPAPVVTVDYSGAKLTICPSPGHDPRYQLPPGAVVVGEFSRQWKQLRAAA